MKSQKLQAFFNYLSRQKSDSDLTDRLAELVDSLKISPTERKDYMTLSEMIQENREEGFKEGRAEGRAEGKAEGRAEGIAQGLSQGRIETAKNFLKNKIDPNLVAKCTGLPLEQVLALQKENCVTLC